MRSDGPTSPPMRWTWAELSGSLGDMGMFLPLAVAMSLGCGLDLGVILIWAGLLNIATGLIFNQPLPVQPMKAIAAIAIVEGVTAGDIAAGGLWMGAALVLLGATGGVEVVARWIPRPVVRGIQLGIGVKLILAGAHWLFGLKLSWNTIQWSGGLPWIGYDGLLIAALAAGLLLIPRLRHVPVLLALFLAGFALLYLGNPAAYDGVGFSWPRFELTLPQGGQWLTGLYRVAIPQLPLTLLNSVVAVCALSADYFPGRGIERRKMSMSVGCMNLLSVPLGGIPVCHGAGGLAAQFRFGARTGGSVIMLGAAKVAVGVAFGASITAMLSSYPKSILAVMLAFAGVMLASAAKDCLRGRALGIVLTTAIAIVLFDTLIGFLAGLVLAAGIGLFHREK